MTDEKTFNEYRQKRIELMRKKFPDTIVVHIRSLVHFARIKNLGNNLFGNDRKSWKHTWYYEDVTGMDMSVLFSKVKEGELLDPVSQGDIVPMMIIGLKDTLDSEQVEKFKTKLSEYAFSIPLVNVYSE